MKNYRLPPDDGGRTTVALRWYPYDQASKRTHSKYAGSFSLHLDPAQIPEVGEVFPGEKRFGISLRPAAPHRLDGEDLECIRSWLRLHGTHERNAAAAREAEAAVVLARDAERARLVAETEQSVRATVVAELRAELESAAAAKVQGPLEALEVALVDAAREVVECAARLKKEGHVLGRQRDWRRADEGETSPLDQLWKRTSRIRLEVFAEFELACQTAGLMACRGTSRSGSAKQSP